MAIRRAAGRMDVDLNANRPRPGVISRATLFRYATLRSDRLDAGRRRHGIEQLPPGDRTGRGRPDLSARHLPGNAPARRRTRRQGATHRRGPAGGDRLPRALRRTPARLFAFVGPRRRHQHAADRDEFSDLSPARGEGARVPDRHHHRPRGGPPHLRRRRPRAAGVRRTAAGRRHRRRLDRVRHRQGSRAARARVAQDRLRRHDPAILCRRPAGCDRLRCRRDPRPRGDRSHRPRLQPRPMGERVCVLRNGAGAGRNPRTERAVRRRDHPRRPPAAQAAAGRGRPHQPPLADGAEAATHPRPCRRPGGDGGGHEGTRHRPHRPGGWCPAPGCVVRSARAQRRS